MTILDELRAQDAPWERFCGNARLIDEITGVKIPLELLADLPEMVSAAKGNHPLQIENADFIARLRNIAKDFK